MTTIELYDTTLRDGCQGEEIAFTLADKLRIAERLDDFGVHLDDVLALIGIRVQIVELIGSRIGAAYGLSRPDRNRLVRHRSRHPGPRQGSCQITVNPK